MTIDPCTYQAADDQAGRYVLQFSAKRVESDYEGVFFTRGGSLGSCAARGDLDVSLTHSKRATHTLLTERLQQGLEIEIPQELVANSTALQARYNYSEGLEANGQKLGPVLFISDRARMNLSSSRIGASINGSVVTSLSGQASMALKDIFSEPQSLGDVLKVSPKGEDASGDATTGAAVEAMPQITGELIKRAKVLVPLNFESIPLSYSNWDAVQSVVSVHEPKVYRVCEDGTRSGPVAVAFVSDKATDLTLAKAEPLLQGIYNSSWETCKNAVFKPSPNLTKSVMNVPAGYNASNYAPAAAVNDTPVGYTDETLESMLEACLKVECSADEMEQIRARLQTPDPDAAMEFSGLMASAMSAFSAFSMPYRIDGTPMILPTGLQMVESESWRATPVRSALQADDCDGSACSAISVVTRATAVAADPALAARFPYLAALGNSLGAHYVFGTCVLAANAGHADAANEHQQKIAGHAIALAIPKVHFLSAMNLGARGNLQGTPVVAVEDQDKVAAARFGALFPPELIARMPDAAMFKDAETLAASGYAHHETGLQPLSMEGTTLASSCMYKHALADRQARSKSFINDKKLATMLAPNITRTHKTLDAGEKGSHAFYNSMVELSVSMKNPLFTSAPLRELNVASPHYRFVRPREDQPIEVAGASPEDLANGTWAALPLWQAGTAESVVLDAAHAEATANIVPMRGEPLALRDEQVESLSASLSLLMALKGELEKRESPTGVVTHTSRHLFSAAALIGNPEAVGAFAKTVIGINGVKGEVKGLDDIVRGVAVDANGNDVVRLVVVELTAPLSEA